MMPYLLQSFKSTAKRRSNSFSECVVAITIYCFIVFNMVSVEDNFILGYFTIGFVSLYILISLLTISRQTYREKRLWLYKIFAKRKFTKQRKYRAKTLEITHERRKERMH